MANGRAAWAGRRRPAAALRKRRGSGKMAAGGKRARGGPGGKRGPTGGSSAGPGLRGPPRARREASGPHQGSPSVSREEDPARLIPLAAQSGGSTFFCGSVHGLFSGAFSLGLGCNFAGWFQESGFSDLPESAGNSGKANAGTRNENLGYERSFRRKRGRGRGGSLSKQPGARRHPLWPEHVPFAAGRGNNAPAFLCDRPRFLLRGDGAGQAERTRGVPWTSVCDGRLRPPEGPRAADAGVNTAALSASPPTGVCTK
ncbi:uncharacterized protein LOC128903235 [Rissa tridactyla]|uniref:uncharacterized protein LOC128903235 n=1 Tax=Rissa tridactyla TaxID=75485 RepID=UPI0023BA7530|nr:uncharacterized protein LOC128903235 [Rissa tridactyla]